MATDLILVHSGNTFPSFLNDTITLAKRHDHVIHLIIEDKLRPYLTHNDINLISIDDIKDDRYSTYTIKNYNTEFRDNFFTRTSSRFILIDNYINKLHLESCFHIESDIALFTNLDHIAQKLDSLPYHTALIMDHSFRCVPSLVWYKNGASSKQMADFIYNNNSLDDMKNLASYFHKYIDTTINLPIVPFDLIDSSLNTINFGNMYSYFESIFDGAAIGQYLYGIDGDNEGNSVGFVNETTVFDPSSLNIVIDNHKPYIIKDNRLIPINNLHMHCKNLQQLL